jgi:O-antigen/teichoic acid export membrane protein
MSFAFIPLYIKYLGIEAYGLIGIFAVLQAWLSLVDAALTPMLNREMAFFKAGTHSVESIRNLLRSIEYIGLIFGILVAASIYLSASWLSINWLKNEDLPVETVANAIAIMGLVAATRLLEGIYKSSIIGLQDLVTYNITSSILVTIRATGAIGVMMWISASIESFFIWQFIMSAVSIIIYGIIAYKEIPKYSERSKFSVGAVKKVLNFSGGLIGITFLALLLTQIDKVLLLRLLTLGEYGYYVLAGTLASSLYMLITPITQALYPRMCELHAQSNEDEIIKKYHLGSQLVSIFMGSFTIVMVTYSYEILTIWTGNSEIANHASTLLKIMAAGNLLNGIMWVPYQTQLAYGWTSLSLKINLIMILIIIPGVIYITPIYGAVGAASIWLVLNSLYVLIGVNFMYKKILINERWRWYIDDILKPIGFSSLLAYLLKIVMPNNLNSIYQLFWIFITLVGIITVGTISSSNVRIMLLKKIEL